MPRVDPSSLAVPVHERTLRANGLSHHVLSWGDPAAEDVVVLCHGFLDMAFGFAPLAPLLARDNLHVLAFDWRGHGESDWVGAGGYYHFVDYALDLHELAPQLSARPFHLVGHSMGGTACTLYAATHPDRIRTLSLLEGLGPPEGRNLSAPERLSAWLSEVDSVRGRGPTKLRDLEHAAARLRARNPELDRDLLAFLARKATRPHPDGDGLMWRFDPLHRTISPMGFDLSRFLQFTAQVKAPTLVIAGERGLRAGDEAVRIATLPDARTAEIAGAGHMMHWTHPEQTAALLTAHFARVA